MKIPQPNIYLIVTKCTSKYKVNEAKKIEQSYIPYPSSHPAVLPGGWGGIVFQRLENKHNFKDVSESKDGKVLLILCNPIGLQMGRASEKGSFKGHIILIKTQNRATT